MNPIRNAHSSNPSVLALVDELRAALGPGPDRLVLYFASPAHPVEALAAAMSRAFAPAAVLGCTTAGELVSGAMLKGSVVAMAFSEEVVSSLAFEVVTGLDRGLGGVEPALRSLGAQLGTSMRELDPTRHVGLVLVDGLSGAEEGLMEVIGDASDVLFVGGSAGDDLAFRATRLFAGGKVYSGAALLAVLRLDRGFSVLKTQSFTPIGKRLVATRVDESRRAVLEFDGRPARDAYAEALGVPPDRIADSFMTHPLGLMAGAEPFVRSPREAVGDEVRFYCAIGKGMELEVLHSRDIVADTHRDLQARRRELGPIAGIVNFNCILRTLELDRLGATGAYGRLFEGVPTVGFSTYGEEYLGHMNQTATMLLIR